MVESRHHGADPRAQRSSPSRPQCDRPQANCATAASGNRSGSRSRRSDVAVDRGVMGDRGRQTPSLGCALYTCAGSSAAASAFAWSHFTVAKGSRR